MKTKVAGLVVARPAPAGSGISTLTAIKRVIMNFQQIGAFPILVVLDETMSEQQYQLATSGVIFAVVPTEIAAEKIKMIQYGIRFLQPICDTVIYGASNVPLFYVETLAQLLVYPDAIIIPVFKARGGHPVVLRAKIFPELLAYQGANGLQGLFRQLQAQRRYVQVDDVGISVSMWQTQHFLKIAPVYRQTLLHPQLQIQLAQEQPVLDRQGKLLLFLIDQLGSVQKAAQMMAISYSKSWKIIRTLEESLATTIVVRRQGGRQKRRATLSTTGQQLLQKYVQFETILLATARQQFNQIFN